MRYLRFVILYNIYKMCKSQFDFFKKIKRCSWFSGFSFLKIFASIFIISKITIAVKKTLTTILLSNYAEIFEPLRFLII